MKRKFFVILVLFIVIVTGCDINNSKTVNIKDKEINDVGDYDLSLNKDGAFKELSFKYPNDCIVNSLDTYTMLTFNKKESDVLLFRIAFSYYENKNIVEVMNSNKVEQKDIKSYNGNNWVMYEVEGHYHNYAIEKNNNTYVIDFIYDDDLGVFEENFMKNVILS